MAMPDYSIVIVPLSRVITNRIFPMKIFPRSPKKGAAGGSGVYKTGDHNTAFKLTNRDTVSLGWRLCAPEKQDTPVSI